MLGLFLSLLLTFSLSVVLIPLSMGLSRLLGAVDVPRDHRRMHQSPMGRLGGVGVFCAILFAAGRGIAGEERISFLLLGVGLILILGMLDDMHPLRALVKLLMELAIVGVTLWYGMEYRGTEWLLSLIWVVTLSNVHNLIDGMDGLLAGAAAVEAALLSVLLLWSGAEKEALLCLLLFAACSGFWLFNRAPAFLFAGDGGALSVGAMLGFLSLSLFGEGEGVWSALSPFFLFAYPLCDLAAALLRRLLRGRPLFGADRGHLHHRIYDAGVPMAQTVRILHLLCLTGGVVALLLSRGEGWEGFSAMGCFAAAALLMSCRKYVERFPKKH